MYQGQENWAFSSFDGTTFAWVSKITHSSKYFPTVVTKFDAEQLNRLPKT